MSNLPLLLLDVDGPLNPYRALFTRHRGYVTRRLHPSGWTNRQAPGSRRLRRGLRVRLHPGHGARLRALPYELAWATTWMHEANEMIAPVIGLPGDLPVIEFTNLFAEDPDGLYWKTRRVVEWAAGRPFVWVDDMITDLDVRHVAEHHEGPALLLRIDPRLGLRDPEFARLERWAHSL
ncbi:HAD domain-containing protein [Streptomyces sp. GESEQ-35]|uniref:HAD domain-containing protein n=1 Tax=Streptomyces sp. GESEQ-35 TaxID=2812657 RepID=UPI001B330286|nr:HAD domain-containing protein [Streptomyces sp. GESEQ-35]